MIRKIIGIFVLLIFIGSFFGTFFVSGENINSNLDNTAQYIKKQTEVTEELNIFLDMETELIKQRKNIAYKIKIEDMPEHLRYTKLHMESKRFLNIIKMICYRAETSFTCIPHIFT